MGYNLFQVYFHRQIYSEAGLMKMTENHLFSWNMRRLITMTKPNTCNKK